MMISAPRSFSYDKGSSLSCNMASMLLMNRSGLTGEVMMMKLLLIEKERSIRRALDLTLRRMHHEVLSTESLMEGYFLNRAHNPDLIIIDSALLLQSGSANDDFRGTPLLVLTEDNGYRYYLLSKGIRTILKPFSLSVFRQMVDSIDSHNAGELSVCS